MGADSTLSIPNLGQTPITGSKISRISSIDLYRGIIMIIMCLDHVRDYFHTDALKYDPLDLSQTSVLLFFTRFITHYCAPTFMLLAGVSAFLSGQRKTKQELSIFLIKRGLWLIFVELVIMDFGWMFNPSFPYLMFIVIWALGLSMILLGGLIYLPRNILLGFSLVLIFGHNLLDLVQVPGQGMGALLWGLVHKQSFFQFGSEHYFVGYPIVPWVGVMSLGYCLGNWYTKDFDPIKRKKNLLYFGVGSLLLFILFRGINIYGDPNPWTVQSSPVYTFLSFLKVAKYPPSLDYILITLGPGFLFLAFSESWKGKWVDIASVYGRVPMFYYILHIYLIHILIMIADGIFTPVPWTAWFLKDPIWFSHSLNGSGFSLGVVYLVWAFVVIALFPLCKWYDGYKQANKDKWWLSYL